jgi:cytochrome c-type biogenesis protein CcmE
MGMAVLGFAVLLGIYSFNDAFVYYYDPAKIPESKIKPGQRIRIGGYVAPDSLEYTMGTQVKFTITDGKGKVKTSYIGKTPLPSRFKETKGAVIEGRFNAQGVFLADKVLAKHDEKYIPKEVVATLKKQGVWRGKEKDKFPETTPATFGKVPALSQKTAADTSTGPSIKKPVSK